MGKSFVLLHYTDHMFFFGYVEENGKLGIVNEDIFYFIFFLSVVLVVNTRWEWEKGF